MCWYAQWPSRLTEALLLWPVPLSVVSSARGSLGRRQVFESLCNNAAVVAVLRECLILAFVTSVNDY